MTMLELLKKNDEELQEIAFFDCSMYADIGSCEGCEYYIIAHRCLSLIAYNILKERKDEQENENI